ncbi:hypothetical protein ACX40Y_02585 [Sphingomonas sp. RS6]
MRAPSDAMRADIAASRARSLAIVGAWKTLPVQERLRATFADCPLDCADPAADRAAALLADSGWIGDLLDPLVTALAADPWFEPPLRASRDALRSGALLFDSPVATLTMSVTNAAALARAAPQPPSIVFTGRVAVTRYIRTGGARWRRWRTEPASPGFSAANAASPLPIADFQPRDGQVDRLDGRIEAQLPYGARHDIVTLTATIRAGASALMRGYDDRLRLARIASADDGASRVEMLLAFLRHSGRSDAGPAFLAATRDPAFHVRWNAMREWLALDARAALPRLIEMATLDPHPEVRAAATAARALVETRMEAAPCPA